MKILLVQPPHWSPDGHANFDAVEALLGGFSGDVVLLPELAGRRLHVLLCADLWYSASLAGRDGLDAVLVPAFSVTRWDGPAPARTLWQHMSVARAYEFMTYVAVSDWHHETTYHGHPCAGVTGLANPCPRTHDGFFTGPPDAPVSVHELDFGRLDAFRSDRADRGFR
ncbi:hypothetical protein [Nonomuraea sp. NPDC049309]|mgnify:CR=1 FL=1|uniref:hypothetical protein n=1 Tax=Nonomuraea sp. NPDC049309 TaxID=3364350 RepID=UPI003724A24B